MADDIPLGSVGRATGNSYPDDRKYDYSKGDGKGPVSVAPYILDCLLS